MLALAHLLPLGLGVAAYVVLVEQPRDTGGYLRALGYGYVVGMAATVLAVSLFAPTPVGAFAPVAIGLLAGTAVLSALGWRYRRLDSAPGPRCAAICMPEPAWTRWLVLALVAWIAFRGASLLVEVSSREVFPWDAWSTWCVKAKTWFMSNQWLAFTGQDAWLANVGSRYIAAAHYPDAMAYLQVWFASAIGAWNEPAIFLFWPACWLAGMAILAGQLRRLGAPWWVCVVATYAWASLPMVQTHVALAGYVDLPMTVAFGAAALALTGSGDAHVRQLWLGATIALCLPLLKHEGALWLAMLVLAALIVRSPVRHRSAAVALAAGAIVLLMFTVGLRLWLPSLGWIEVEWGRLRIEGISLDVALQWRAVHAEVIGSLLFASNWNLLWWIGPVVAFASLRHWRELPMLGTTLVLALGCVFVIFFFTDASAWAEDLTAVNRVLMQVTLIAVAWIAWMSAACAGALRPASADPAGRTAERISSHRDAAYV